MSELKRKKNKYGEFIVVKSKKGQGLNQREYDVINSNQAKGFLHMNVEYSRDKFELGYEMNGLLTVPDFLQEMVLSKRLFAIILQKTITPLKDAEKHYLNKNLIYFNLNYMMIDPSDWNVYYIYIPIQPFEAKGTLKEVLLELVRYARFDYSEGYEFVQEFIRIVNAGVSFSAFDLDVYIQSLTSIQTEKKETVPQTKAMKQDEEKNYNPIGKVENRFQESIEKVPVLSNQILVNEDDRGVVTVFRASKNQASLNVWIENKSDGTRISVNRNSFRIGKSSREADYKLVDEQNSVSRKHADIIKEQGKYYIVDLGSTNGTFVNGRRIQPGVREELSDNSVIGIANVEFIFHMN